MLNRLKYTDTVRKFYEVLRAEDQGLITKTEASDILFTYVIENKLTVPNNNASVVDIYFRMVAENMDNLQWERITKKDLTVVVSAAVGRVDNDLVELGDIDEDGLSSDYAFLVGIFENYGYVDIYYLIPPIDSEVLLITGMTVSDE